MLLTRSSFVSTDSQRTNTLVRRIYFLRYFQVFSAPATQMLWLAHVTLCQSLGHLKPDPGSEPRPRAHHPPVYATQALWFSLI